jgi:predicted GTPase
VILAYSDVPHEQIMHLGFRALATGADFSLLGPNQMTLRSRLPVIAVTAVRTGCGMSLGAGYVAGTRAGAAIVDPRTSAPPAIRSVYEAYPHIGPVLPAVGYNSEQLHALKVTVSDSEADLVISATPFDIAVSP